MHVTAFIKNISTFLEDNISYTDFSCFQIVFVFSTTSPVMARHAFSLSYSQLGRWWKLSLQWTNLDFHICQKSFLLNLDKDFYFHSLNVGDDHRGACSCFSIYSTKDRPESKLQNKMIFCKPYFVSDYEVKVSRLMMKSL